MSDVDDAEPCDTCEVERIKAASSFELEERKAGNAKAQALADAASDRRLERVKARLTAAKADLDDELAHDAAEAELDRELRKLYHTTLTEISKGAIDRSRDSAKFIQTAAAALITAYVALLGLVFSVTERQLPLRGVYTAAFLAMAIAGAVAFLAFLGKPATVDGYQPGPSDAETQVNRTVNLITWTNAAVGTRGWALRSAVVAFGFGVAFVPAAFVGPNVAQPRSVEPPAIPAQVGKGLEAPALRLFEQQVDNYLGQLDGPVAGQAAETVAVCTDFGEFHVLRACGWRTEDQVERNFRAFAAVAALIVLLAAVTPGIRRKFGGPSRGGPHLPVVVTGR